MCSFFVASAITRTSHTLLTKRGIHLINKDNLIIERKQSLTPHSSKITHIRPTKPAGKTDREDINIRATTEKGGQGTPVLP